MAQKVGLCRIVLDEHYGPIVASVGETLLREASTFQMLVHQLNSTLKPPQIRRSLAILEQHNIVSFSMQNAQRAVYKAHAEHILALIRAPRCCMIIKLLYGTVAESICEVIIGEGRLTCSEIIRRVAARHDDVGMGEIKEKFVRLAESQFVTRLPQVEDVFRGCPMFANLQDPYLCPDLVLQDVRDSIELEGGSRKRKAAPADRDEGIYWKLNIKRFDRYLRDQLILGLLSGNKTANAMTKSDVICRNTVAALLKVNELRATAPSATESFPIPIFDIMRAVKDSDLGLEKNDVEWALKVLADDSNGVLRKAGDSSGGLYVVDFGRAIRQLASQHLESMIREQLDSKAVRIFRLLIKNGFMEEEHIEKEVMMSAKQTRELLYAMMEENYVTVRPMGKTNDFAPARTFYLYSVDFERCVRLAEECTFKILRNLILRRHHETKEHHNLLDRKQKLENIKENIEKDDTVDEETREQQKTEVEELYLSTADHQELEHYEASRKKLMAAELEIEHAMFIFRMHLFHSERPPLPKIGRQRKNILDTL